MKILLLAVAWVVYGDLERGLITTHAWYTAAIINKWNAVSPFLSIERTWAANNFSFSHQSQLARLRTLITNADIAQWLIAEWSYCDMRFSWADKQEWHVSPSIQMLPTGDSQIDGKSLRKPNQPSVLRMIAWSESSVSCLCFVMHADDEREQVHDLRRTRCQSSCRNASVKVQLYQWSLSCR